MGAIPCTCSGRKGYFVGMYWGTFSECVKVSREICVRDIGYEKRLYNRIQAWASAGVFTRTIWKTNKIGLSV